MQLYSLVSAQYRRPFVLVRNSSLIRNGDGLIETHYMYNHSTVQLVRPETWARQPSWTIGCHVKLLSGCRPHGQG